MIEKISPKQLFCLIILEQIGSTTLFTLGIDAKQDAWIAILISLFVGLGLVWVYTEIISGILLTISLVTMIAVLGVNLTAISTIPLFKAIRHISIAHFLQRFDAIGGAIYTVALVIVFLYFLIKLLKNKYI